MNKRCWKRIAVLFVSLWMMIFCVAGCGGQEPAESEPEWEEITEKATTTTAADEEESSEPISDSSAPKGSSTKKTSSKSKQKTTKTTTKAEQTSGTTATTKPASKYNNGYGVQHIFNAYVSSARTAKQFIPAVGYLKNGKVVDTMFDSFFVLCPPNSVPNYKKANLSSWIRTSLSNVDKLEEATAEVKGTLGLKDYKVNVFLTLFLPDTTMTSFGEVDGKDLNISNFDDEVKAVQWLERELQAQFNARGYKNVHLSGFYWQNEAIRPEEEAITSAATDYARKLGLISYICPFYRARGYTETHKCGFELATMQANYFPGHPGLPNGGGYDRLASADAIIKANNIGIQMELAQTSNEMDFTGFKQYMRAGVQYDWMNGLNAYYFYDGPDSIYNVSHSSDSYKRSTYDELYKYVKGTLTEDDIWIK